MTGPRDGRDDGPHELDRLLGLVDGPSPLPRGAEDKLLASILETATQPRVAPAADDDPADAAQATARPRPRSRSTRTWQAVAAVLAVTATIVVVAMVRPQPAPFVIDDVAGVVDSAAGPSLLVDDGVVVTTTAATLDQLCSFAEDRVASLELGAERPVLGRPQVVAAGDLSVVLDELVARAGERTGDHEGLARVAQAVPVARLVVEAAAQDDDAVARRAAERLATLLVGPPPYHVVVGCPAPASHGSS